MQKHVLVVTNMFPSTVDPSYGQFVQRCVLGLNAAGIRTDVVGLAKQHKSLAKVLRYVAFSVRANIKILSRRYDCVYIHHPLHTLLACLPALAIRNVSLALNFHGHDLVPVEFRGAVLQKMVGWKIRKAQVVIVPSEHFRRIFETRFGNSGARAKVFRSGGIQNAYFLGDKQCTKTRGRTALFLSRLTRKKGWETFVEVARRLRTLYPDFRFTISGIGPDRDAIAEAVAVYKLGDCVDIVSATSAIENRQLFENHRYFIFPTQLDESLALVNLEAMACGCIVYSANFSAAAEYIEDSSDGFLIPLADFVERCVAGICSMEAAPDLASDISLRARAKAARYQEEIVMAELPTILNVGSS